MENFDKSIRELLILIQKISSKVNSSGEEIQFAVNSSKFSSLYNRTPTPQYFAKIFRTFYYEDGHNIDFRNNVVNQSTGELNIDWLLCRSYISGKKNSSSGEGSDITIYFDKTNPNRTFARTRCIPYSEALTEIYKYYKRMKKENKVVNLHMKLVLALYKCVRYAFEFPVLEGEDELITKNELEIFDRNIKDLEEEIASTSSDAPTASKSGGMSFIEKMLESGKEMFNPENFNPESIGNVVSGFAGEKMGETIKNATTEMKSKFASNGNLVKSILETVNEPQISDSLKSGAKEVAGNMLGGITSYFMPGLGKLNVDTGSSALSAPSDQE